MITRKIYTYLLLLMSTFIFSACMTDDPLNQTFETYEPRDINDGLIISSPTAQNMDTDDLTNIYQSIYSNEELWPLRSMLVFRNGQLVSEAYLKDENDISTRHLIWSCTKQVIGILTGIALDKELIDNIEDPISYYFDSELTNHQDKSSITIENMITMRSGIAYSNDGIDGQTDKILRQIPDNSTDYILSLPINAAQGTLFNYNDGNPQLMSALIQKIVNKPTDIWADEFLFSKIGVTNYNWVRYKDGVTLGGFGIETSPRELAKLALCVADSGRWDGAQIVSSDWIVKMTSEIVDLDDSDYSFGYYWWIDTTRDIQFMWGHGGQFAFIVPAKDLVVIMTSIPNTQGGYQINADQALKVVDRIVAAAY